MKLSAKKPPCSDLVVPAVLRLIASNITDGEADFPFTCVIQSPASTSLAGFWLAPMRAFQKWINPSYSTTSTRRAVALRPNINPRVRLQEKKLILIYSMLFPRHLRVPTLTRDRSRLTRAHGRQLTLSLDQLVRPNPADLGPAQK